MPIVRAARTESANIFILCYCAGCSKGSISAHCLTNDAWVYSVKSLAQISLAVGALVLLYLTYTGWPEIRHFLRVGDPQQITAEVRLTNRCAIPEESFVVRQVQNGRTAAFSNGVARIDVLEGDYLELQLSARYSEVQFNGFRQRASQKMTMTADCGKGERMQGTMDSMRDKFGD